MSSPVDVAAGAAGKAAADSARRARWRARASLNAVRLQVPSRAAVAALLAGLIVTAALCVTAMRLYERNETRLLGLRVHELGLVLTSSLPSIQTPLASAAALADATDGNAAKFSTIMAEYVGPGRKFVSASLWPLGAANPAPSVVVGSAPKLASLPGKARAFFAHSEKTFSTSVTGILGASNPRLGYEFNSSGVTHGFAVYAESLLPSNRESQLVASSGFSDLYYALYLGHSRSPAELLLTNRARFPTSGRLAWINVPFGDGSFTLVVAPRGSLGGSFFESLPWVIALAGAMLTLAGTLMTGRLARRRRQAEELAGVLDRVASENRQMYTEQRSIAQTLQHALMPDALPHFRGLEVSARYVPAGAGIDVGGDWYDILETTSGRALLVLGDVSGHGLRAASTMASLRHAALAYAVQDDRPAGVLRKLASFVNSGAHDYFATVLCILVDVQAHELTIASAGHLAPLLIDRDGGRFIDAHVGLPIGVAGQGSYRDINVPVSPGSTLIAFTDGLIERRGEVLDIGLERLRDAATTRRMGLEELIVALTHEVPLGDHHDDTAIVGIRWQR